MTSNNSSKSKVLAYENLVEDATRAKNRLQAIFRGRGLDPGRAIYRPDQRDQWLAKLKDEATRFRAESLLDQLAALRELRKQAKKRFVLRARQHPDYRILSGLPGFGPVHVGQLIASVGTPHRFRTKRQFWPYCGLAVVTRSSADYKIVEGQIVKSPKKVSTRGLNRNQSPRLKGVFKSAALTSLRYEECQAYYQRLVAGGTRPELARVSVARKLAAAAADHLAAQGGIRGEEIFRHCLSRNRAGKIFVLLYQAAMRKAESQTHHRSRESLN